MKEARFTSFLLNEPVELAYTDWGDPENPRVVVCVHGLTRNCRDFDFLAERLSEKYRVICPDIVGRGKSSWLNNKLGYAIPTYVIQMQAMLMQLNLSRVDWVGTSMGGLIGMAMAAMPFSPIQRMVLNDVGPFLPASSLKGIGQYITASNRTYPDMHAIESHVRQVYREFGDLTDAQWTHMAKYSAFRQDDGTYRLTFDPGIVQIFTGLMAQDVEMWELWKKITCPILVLRGELSALLSRDTLQKMQNRPELTKTIEIPGVGHAPALMDPEQIALITHWLSN